MITADYKWRMKYDCNVSVAKIHCPVQKMQLASYSLIIFLFNVVTADLRRILPTSLQVRDGEDIELRLTSALDENLSCYVKTPSQVSYNLESSEPDSDKRISNWTVNGECGVRIKNISKLDEGRWRLTAKNASRTLVDVTLVEVLEKFEKRESLYSIESGIDYTLVLEANSKYCTIADPASDSSVVVSGECKIDLSRPTTAAQGTWSAIAGVVGQIEEVATTAELRVSLSKLVSGFNFDSVSNRIHAFCNLRDNDHGIDFCRFVKPNNNQTGFQLSDGLRSGNYGYYGAGLAIGECGISIENPQHDDYGQWQCIIGSTDDGILGSFVNIEHPQRSLIRAEALPSNPRTTTIKSTLELQCHANVPLSYCWFVSPTGDIFTPQQSSESTEELYRYIGTGFAKGHCGMELLTAETQHNGQWSCHMGPMDPGKELTSVIDVRISETPLAAEEQRITINDGQSLSIHCRTVPNNIALTYCRFHMPDGTGIHMSDTLTENNPLELDGIRYWFSGRSLRLGDCGVTIDRASSIHIGKWTCAAILESETTNSEAYDTISVERHGASSEQNLTAGAASGIAMAVLVVLGLIIVATLYVIKKVKKNNNQQPRNNFLEMDEVSVNSSNSSSSTPSDAPITSPRQNQQVQTST